jgi:hypothetical protein
MSGAGLPLRQLKPSKKRGGIKENHGWVEEWSGTPDPKPAKKRALNATPPEEE